MLNFILNSKKSIALVLVLLNLSCFHGLFAQPTHSNLSAERIKFESLSDNQRIEKIAGWYTQSLSTEIPSMYKKMLDTMEQKNLNQPGISAKKMSTFNMLFNTKLTIIERILAAEFLLNAGDSSSSQNLFLEMIRTELVKSLNHK